MVAAVSGMNVFIFEFSMHVGCASFSRSSRTYANLRQPRRIHFLEFHLSPPSFSLEVLPTYSLTQFSGPHCKNQAGGSQEFISLLNLVFRGIQNQSTKYVNTLLQYLFICMRQKIT